MISNMPQTFSLVPTTQQVGGAPEQVDIWKRIKEKTLATAGN